MIKHVCFLIGSLPVEWALLAVAGMVALPLSAQDSIPASDLEEVVVEASNVRREGDLLINVFSDKDFARASDAGELIGTINGARYNKITKLLEYRNSTNVIILVDGIPKDQDFTKAQYPKKFVRAEVTTNPVGQYSSYDAVINLITRKTYVGYRGNIRGNMSVNPGNGYGHGKNVVDAGGEGNFSFTDGKWTLEGSAMRDWSRNGSDFHSETTYAQSGISEWKSSQENVSPMSRSIDSNGRYFVSAGYSINDNHLISAQWNLQDRCFHRWLDGSLLYRRTGETADTYAYSNSQHDNSLTNMWVIYYKGKINDWSLYASAGYSLDNLKRNQSYITSQPVDINNDRTIKSDYFWYVANAERYFFDKKLKLSISDNGYRYKIKVNSRNEDAQRSENDAFHNMFYASLGYMPVREWAFSLSAGCVADRVWDADNACDYV